MFFQPKGRRAMRGDLPNVDFQSSYMPLFPYVMRIVDKIWPNDLAIPLFFGICFVAAGLLLRQFLIEAGTTTVLASSLFLIGMFNGATWFLSIGCQQDEVMIVLFQITAILLLLRNQPVASGTALGFGLFTTKVLFLIPAAAIILQSKKSRQNDPWIPFIRNSFRRLVFDFRIQSRMDGGFEVQRYSLLVLPRYFMQFRLCTRIRIFSYRLLIEPRRLPCCWCFCFRRDGKNRTIRYGLHRECLQDGWYFFC